MSNILNIQEQAYEVFISGGTILWLFQWTGSYVSVPGAQPNVQQLIQIGSPQDPMASPPIFPDPVTAIAYYRSSLCATLLANVNSGNANNYFTSYAVSSLSPEVQAAFDSLAEVAFTGNASDLNDYSSLVTNSSLSATLGGYATNSAVSAALSGKFNVPTGSTSQYVRGDGTLASFPTVISVFTNDSGYITSSSLSPYLTSSVAASTYATQSSLTSGLAGKFNTPSGSTSQVVLGNGTLGTLPSTTRTTTGITPTLVGTGATGTQVSSTKDSTVSGTFSTQVSITLGGSPISRVVMKVCSTNSATESDWIERGRTGTSQPTTLTITVGGVYLQEGQVTGDVPAAWYYKFVNSGSGTHTEAVIAGYQTIYG